MTMLSRPGERPTGRKLITNLELRTAPQETATDDKDGDPDTALRAIDSRLDAAVERVCDAGANLGEHSAPYHSALAEVHMLEWARTHIGRALDEEEATNAVMGRGGWVELRAKPLLGQLAVAVVPAVLALL